MNYNLHLTAVCLSLILSSCATKPVETCSLRDQIISIAKETKGTGVEKVKFTTAVTKTKEGSVTVVVPVTVATGTFGMKRSHVGANTVEMEINVAETSDDEISGSVYDLNPVTLEAQKQD